jgi:hypothetical protein
MHDSPMIPILVIINLFDYGLDKLVIIFFMHGLLVDKHLIRCNAQLSHHWETINRPILKWIHLMIAIDCFQEGQFLTLWCYSNFFLKRMSYTRQSIPNGTDRREEHQGRFETLFACGTQGIILIDLSRVWLHFVPTLEYFSLRGTT